MTYLNRGRPIFGDIGRPPEPAPEPVTFATGLPVEAPAPADGTDDLRTNKRIEALAFNAITRALSDADVFVLLSDRQKITSAVLEAVQPELDRLTERIPYREGETEEQYLERQIARWRSEAWQARAKLREAEAEQDRLKAAIGPAVNHDEPCGNREPADRRLTCTLREGHLTHYAAGSGTAWACICAPTADQAAIARVRAALDDADWGGPERGEVIAEIRAALDRSDLPAVREFAANLDPRGCDCQAGITEAGCPIHDRPEEPTCPT